MIGKNQEGFLEVVPLEGFPGRAGMRKEGILSGRQGSP